ncbi:MAG TPA: hypothetical protein VG326_03380 [Tepidisphaeraceae bacterium]|jgi:hypothetical protein|nr:hypothetical protein [Tepidisphaeraceae bacterium]
MADSSSPIEPDVVKPQKSKVTQPAKPPCDALATVQTPTITLSEEQLKFLSVAYTEAGQWARHFSTVRMTLTPFLIGISLGVLSFGWEKPSNGIFMLFSAVICVLMVILLGIFTFYLEKRWCQQRNNHRLLAHATGLHLVKSDACDDRKIKTRNFLIDPPFLIAVAFTLLLSWFCWHHYQEQHNPADQTQRATTASRTARRVTINHARFTGEITAWPSIRPHKKRRHAHGHVIESLSRPE